MTGVTVKEAVFLCVLDKGKAAMVLRTNAFERQRKRPMGQTGPVKTEKWERGQQPRGNSSEYSKGGVCVHHDLYQSSIIESAEKHYQTERRP